MKKICYIQLAVILICIFAFTIGMSFLLCYQCSSDEVRIKLYYNEPKNSLDVLFFGSSAVRAGYIPTIGYENYGFTSYDYTVNHAPLPIMKYMIEEALENQSPKLLVIDINGITYCNKEFTSNKVNGFTENINNTKIKNEINNKVLNKTSNIEDRIPFFNYHSNWQNLSLCLQYQRFFKNYGHKISKLKGYTTQPVRIHVYKEDDFFDSSTISEMHIFNDYEQNTLNELFEYCDSIKTKILFVRFPRLNVVNNNEWEIPYINAIASLIQEKGYDFIDFSNYVDEIGLDVSKDYNDQTHLNHFGAEKFTNYLSNYIVNNYDVITEKNEKLTKSWDKSVSKTKKYYEFIKSETMNNTKRECYEFDYVKFEDD